MESITAVIITKNEERNIGRCLESLQGVADEVVVVDSGSTDQTEAICREHGARFVHHDWEDYSAQKNYANSLATHPWLLSIDADEALSPTLRENLLRLKAEGLDCATVYSFNRLTNYCGHWIRHCGWYPDRKERLWAADRARWDGEVHEELFFDQPMNHQTLAGDLLHYSYHSTSEMADRQLRYATLAAEKAFRQGKRCPAGAPVLKPCWTFVRNYLLRGGFRDGAAGFTVCRMSAYYTFLKYTLLRERYSSPTKVR